MSVTRPLWEIEYERWNAANNRYVRRGDDTVYKAGWDAATWHATQTTEAAWPRIAGLTGLVDQLPESPEADAVRAALCDIIDALSNTKE